MEQLANAGQQIDFSLIALFMRASLIVKIVMVLLIRSYFLFNFILKPTQASQLFTSLGP